MKIDAIRDATNLWIDHHKIFSMSDIMDSFPWVNRKLAEEEISFWITNGLISAKGDKYQRTRKNLDKSLLFLDVDGVLNHSKGNWPIDEACLCNLGRIIHETGAIIILISSWKAGWYKDEKEYQDDDANYLDEKLASAGLQIFDKSSRHLGNRTFAVIDFVMKFNASSWVILDDDYQQYRFEPLKSRCVGTSHYEGGLTCDLAEKAISILR